MDKISTLYDNYSDIINEFGKSKIQERFQDLYIAYNKFIEDKQVNNSVQLNSFTLMHAVLDYFTDISRLKRFHKIKRTNSFKIIAYELSWLVRRKPLQILEDDKEELVYINEKFILSYIMSYFTQLVGFDFYDKLEEKNKKAFDGYVNSLYYYLKYRNCSSQSLEFALLSFGAGVAAANGIISEELLDKFFDN
ncbi:hypothetical protein [Frisingicoccus sp.]|uniref:hypothetical protein n=1 Tax=Frisingicoccus sp. TaxID=1918627 RepID=UPI00399AF2C0